MTDFVQRQEDFSDEFGSCGAAGDQERMKNLEYKNTKTIENSENLWPDRVWL